MSDESVPLPRWTEGQPVSAARLNEMQQRLDSVRFIRGGPGVSVTQGPDGAVISLADDAPARPAAVAVTIGPGVSSNAAGFYHGTMRLPTSTAAATAALSLPENMMAGRPCIVMNAAEDGGAVAPVPSGACAVGVLAGVSGTTNTPLVLTHVAGPALRVLVVSGDWTVGSGTVRGTILGSTNVVTADLLYGAAAPPYCGLSNGAVVGVLPYAAGGGTFGLAVGWPVVPATGSNGEVLQFYADGSLHCGYVRAEP